MKVLAPNGTVYTNITDLEIEKLSVAFTGTPATSSVRLTIPKNNVPGNNHRILVDYEDLFLKKRYVLTLGEYKKLMKRVAKAMI